MCISKAPAVYFKDHKLQPPVLRKSAINTGAPIMAVSTDTGISDGLILRATVSTNIINTAPILTDAGTNTRLSLPSAMRQICGINKPTQPTCPQVETHAAVIMVLAKAVVIRNTLTFEPLAKISSSDIGRMFRRQRIA